MPRSKRTAVTGAGGVQKKAKHDTALSKCSDIAAMVKGATEDFPEDVLRMLSSIVQASLTRPKEERHPFQATTADMIGQALLAVQRRRAEAVASLEAKVGEGDAEHASRTALRGAAVEELESATAAAANADAALKEAVATAKEAASKLAEARKNQEDGNAASDKAARDKARLEAAIAGDYLALKEGGPRKPLKAVLKIAQDFNFSPQLLQAAETTLAKPPAARGTFDGLVVSELDAAFAAAVAALADRLAAEEPERAMRDGKVEEAAKGQADADEFKASRQGEADAAHAALRAAEAKRKDAARAVKDFFPEMSKTKVMLASASADLRDSEAVVAAFNELLERTLPPPEPAVQEVAAEGDATGAVGAEGAEATT